MRSLSTIMLALLAVPSWTCGADPPRIFAPAADVARMRAAIAADPKFAQWADQLVEQAQAANLSELPALERSWWEVDRTTPWSETYRQIFHHTWIVPARWADMARTCAWAGVLRPETKLSDKARQVLNALADFTFEFEHYDIGLNYTVWAVEAMEAYELLYESCSPTDTSGCQTAKLCPTRNTHFPHKFSASSIVRRSATTGQSAAAGPVELPAIARAADRVKFILGDVPSRRPAVSRRSIDARSAGDRGLWFSA